METTKIYFSDFGMRTLKNGSFYSKNQDNISFAVGHKKQGNGVDGYTQRTFLKYNLSSLPAKLIISNATLNIYCNYANYTDNLEQGYYNLELHKVTNDWNFSTLETEPTFQTSVLQTITGKLSTETWYSFDITSIIQNIYTNTEQNYGIMFKHQIDTWSATTISSTMFQSPLYTENVELRPYIEITYINTVPPAPIPTEPIGVYKDSGSSIRFGWNVSGTQTKFNLYWSNNNGGTWNKISQTTANNYYNVPAGTLPTGQISWKVTIFNEYNEESPDSTVNVFTATGIPAAPIITDVTNTDTPKPTIVWNSSDQQVYQVQILQGSNVVYDTGDIPSISVKSHTITTFLPDGDYVVKVRVKNEFDLYSSWAIAQFTIETPKPVKPPILLSQNEYSIDVTSNIGDNSYLLLYRTDINSSDFKCIAKSTTNIMKDFTIESNKQYKYFVRTISSTGTYLDSDIKTITSAKINRSIFAPVTNLSNVFEVKYNLNERPVKNITISTPSTTNYFSGRKYPVVEYSEHLSSGITLSFFIQNESEYQQLLNIFYLKGIVLYRDRRRKFYGNINGFNISDHFAGYEVNLSINQTDYNEYLEV